MLQYSDLTLHDIDYYWRNSILLIEQKGDMVPCKIYDIDSDNQYPITLTDLRTGVRITNLRLSTFIRKVLIHHPALGYGDYKGVPFYISTRAGAEKRKGVNSDNLFVLCPISWKKAAMKRLEVLTKQANSIINSGKARLPSSLSKEYHKLQAVAANLDNNIRLRGRGRIPRQGLINIDSNKIKAHIIYQCVNNKYPTLRAALHTMRTDIDTSGISISRDFAVTRSSDIRDGYLAVFHKMARIGCINIITGLVSYDDTLSKSARAAIDLAFDRVKR